MNTFVAGVYGVGKTYVCDKVANQLSIPHFSASRVIKHGKVRKSVDDVGINQQRLVSGLSVINKKYSSVLLDGHFAILKNNSTVALIDTSIFRGLSLNKIIVLTQEPNVIYERLRGRNGELFDVEFIKQLQEKEVHQAKQVAFDLDVPLLIIKSDDESIPKIISFIDS